MSRVECLRYLGQNIFSLPLKWGRVKIPKSKSILLNRVLIRIFKNILKCYFLLEIHKLRRKKSLEYFVQPYLNKIHKMRKKIKCVQAHLYKRDITIEY